MTVQADRDRALAVLLRLLDEQSLALTMIAEGRRLDRRPLSRRGMRRIARAALDAGEPKW